VEFEWDERNLHHMLTDRPHGISPELVLEVSGRVPRLFPNAPDAARTRSGSDLMVGPDVAGRFWTIVLLDRRNGLWRPITGWPSIPTEIRLYMEDQRDTGQEA
jgi:hypothetical protein